MKSVRERFEEIWPVPDQIQWSRDRCAYWKEQYGFMLFAAELNLRLDTFTRCQETTEIYSGIVDDMIREMELINSVSTDLRAVGIAREAIGRAKQKMGMMK